MRKAVKFMVAGTVSFLLLVVGFVAYLGWELRPQPPTSQLPALVRDLPGPLVTDAQKAFYNRVRAKFPNGMGADALAAELQREGFKLGRARPEFHTPRPYFALVEQHGGMCLRSWHIRWQRDEQGRAQDIDGRFHFDCP